MHTYTDVRMCVYTYICVCLCINTHPHTYSVCRRSSHPSQRQPSSGCSRPEPRRALIRRLPCRRAGCAKYGQISRALSSIRRASDCEAGWLHFASELRCSCVCWCVCVCGCVCQSRKESVSSGCVRAGPVSVCVSCIHPSEGDWGGEWDKNSCKGHAVSERLASMQDNGVRPRAGQSLCLLPHTNDTSVTTSG